MSAKPPATPDDVTKPVGGAVVARPQTPEPGGEADAPRAAAPPERRDDSKTMIVNFDEQSEQQAPPAAQPPVPSPRLPPARLSWPARDQSSPRPAGSAPQNRGLPSEPPDDRTRLFRTNAADAAQAQVATGETAPAEPNAHVGRADDPTVGWLVIMEGAGRGRSLELGIGANAIGRDSSQKVSLRFGDLEVHRERHALVIFDPRSRKFFVQSGEVRNLTYVDDELVLTPVEIKGGETIVVGQTRLKFVPFCGPDFSW